MREKSVGYGHACLLGFLLLLAGLLIGLHPQIAEAHAQVAGSSLPNGSTVAPGVTTIVLTFTEQVSPEQSDGRLSDGTGRVIATVTSNVRPDKRTVMTVNSPPLTVGDYTLRWRTVTEDDNGVTEGTIAFTVSASAPTQPASATVTQPAGSTEATGGETSPFPWFWVLLSALILLIVSVVMGVLLYRQGTAPRA